jgi:CheY-like chemotaxis protein
VKFTESGRVLVEIDRALEGNQSLIHFTVSDTGIGIAPEKLVTIFDRFVQADPSTVRRFGGTGLGLSICRDLVSMMGGTIDVKSQIGQGSVFHFALRLPERRFEEPSRAISDVDRTIDAVAGARILLVEDNAVNQKLCRYMLERLGCSVDIAENGSEALDAVERAKYALIFMDCQMPVMDGYQATAAIRMQAPSRIPIVALTAHAAREDRDRCLSAGMDDYLSKPVRRKDLESMLLRWVSAVV